LFAGGTQMRMKIRALAAVAGIMLALGASPSRAAIVETIIDTDSNATVGSITFPTFTGVSDAGVLFSYGGFTQADITSISWSLDPTTAAVVTLDLNALQGDNPCPNGGDCSNTTLNLTPTLATMGGTSCSFSGDSASCEAFERVADIRFAPVPEPSTWAMMVVGFVGLGLAGRRSMRQAAG
jgi:PEP-CTERM motif